MRRACSCCAYRIAKPQKFNQRADVEDLLADRTGKRRVRRYETQIAHGEGDDHDGHRRGRRGSGRQRGRGLAEIAAFNQPSQAETQCVGDDEQHDGRPIVIRESAVAHADERDDLPMQRRHQFGQHERACRDVQSFAFAGAGAEQNRQRTCSRRRAACRRSKTRSACCRRNTARR